MEKNKKHSVTECKVHNLSINIIDRLQQETESTLKGLQNLPGELEKQLSQLKDLHTKTLDDLRRADRLSAHLLKNIRSFSPEEQTEKYGKVQDLYKQVLNYGDSKVSLATQTYELVDRHIRRLDSDLARFEADLKDKTLNPVPELDKKKTKTKERRRGRRPVSDDDEIPKSVRRKLKMHTLPQPEITPLADPLEIARASDVLDMPVDPNEPTYCFCHQVSYGEMIGCDNSDCPIEWFHFACVGLTAKPKGKWYCSNCSAERKKKPEITPLPDSLEIAQTSDALHMPVDSGELTYCVCQQMSYGKMICCEHSNCPIGWFHFECVGLGSKPKGKWYCPHCLVKRRKN